MWCHCPESPPPILTFPLQGGRNTFCELLLLAGFRLAPASVVSAKRQRMFEQESGLRSLFVRRFYKAQAEQLPSECVHIFLAPCFPNPHGDDENHGVSIVHPIDDPIPLSNNAEASIAPKLPDKRFALFRWFFRQAINRLLKLRLDPAVSNIFQTLEGRGRKPNLVDHRSSSRLTCCHEMAFPDSISLIPWRSAAMSSSSPMISSVSVMDS